MKNQQAQEMQHIYCKPWNAGLASETKSVERRLGRLLDALSDEVNGHIVSGSISEEIFDFKIELIDKLRRDGWSVTCPGNNFRVRSQQTSNQP